MSIDTSIRKLLIKLAGSRKTRINYWTPSRPGDVRNPKGILDTHFTDASAWDLVVEHLRAGTEVETIELNQPRGKTAFVMKIDLGADEEMLYVKIELGSGKVVGRSFHYSKHHRKPGDKLGNK